MKLPLLLIASVSAMFTAKGQMKKLIDFTDNGGSKYECSMATDGTALYGTALQYSNGVDGFIFRIMPDGSGYSVLFNFAAATSGHAPRGKLLYDGTFLYGTCESGGANNKGTIYRIKTDGSDFLKLFDFAGSSTGENPEGGLITDGTNLYGTAMGGGNSGFGVVYKISKTGTGFTKLRDFFQTDGCQPVARLLLNGSYLYGTTLLGGSTNNGVVFRIKPDGTGFSMIHQFAGGGADGDGPMSELAFDGTMLHGLTYNGGTDGKGVVYRLKPDGSSYFIVRHLAVSDGNTPFGGLEFYNGYLYGSNSFAGEYGYGTFFRYKANTTGGLEILLKFNTSTGGFPLTSPLLKNGIFYLTNSIGGDNSMGTLVSIDPNCTSMVTSVSYVGNVLVAQPTVGLYQWLDCSTGANYAMINNATSNTSPPAPGFFALQYQEDFCMDTSVCMQPGTQSVPEFERDMFELYPNPADDKLQVKVGEGNFRLSLIDLTGKSLKEEYVSRNTCELNIRELPAGIYFLRVQYSSGISLTRKVIRE